MSDIARNQRDDPSQSRDFGGDGVLRGGSVEAVAAPPPEELWLPSGRLLTIESDEESEGEAITIRAPSGDVELSIRLTPDGPKLRFEAAELELDSPGRVGIRCDEYAVHARKGILLQSEGDTRTEAGGRIVSVAEGDAVHQARATTIRSTRGDVFIKANDDARVHGERVRLNC